MNYEEAVQYRDQIQEGQAIKPGLAIIRRLMESLGNPQDELKFVHVAGTNGKGSTSTFIASVLATKGMKVGRFISPVVFDDMEKIQYQTGDKSIYMKPEEYAKQMERIQNILETQWTEERVPTVFEIETAIAFCLFLQWNCDVVVLEVGMGGADDSTNVVENVLVSVITPISMDHMAFLGDSLEKIAAAKAGIVKKKTPIVSYQPEIDALYPIMKKAIANDSKVSFVDPEQIRIIKMDLKGSYFDYKNHMALYIPLCGEHQIYNACLAIECLHLLGATKDEVKEGFSKVAWPGRFEVLEENPYIILDGAHNLDGIKSLKKSLKRYLKNQEIVGIMGVFADKQVEEMVQEISPCFKKIYTIQAPTSRGLSEIRLAKTICQCGGVAESCESVNEAIQRAKNEKKAIIIFGSLSIMQEIKRSYK